MKAYESKEITYKKDRLVGVSCDECGRFVGDGETHYEVLIGRNDWDADSIDSIKTLDICNVECLMDNIVGYFNKAKGTEFYEIQRDKVKLWRDENETQ